MQIGDFARLGGVSVKTLRHYEERGLLAPAWVDPSSGYRFYTLAQADRLAQIITLRLVDFSLTEIAALINSEDRGLDEPLNYRMAALHNEHQTLLQKLAIADIVRRLEPNIGVEHLKLAPIKETLVYSVERTVPSLGDPVTEIFEQAERDVAEWRGDSAPYMKFHNDPSTTGPQRIEVCIPVTREAEGMSNVKRDQGAALSCGHIYAGGYHQTETAFREMKALLRKAGLEASGPLREIYHRFGADCEDYTLPVRRLTDTAQQYLTELRLPININSHDTEKQE